MQESSLILLSAFCLGCAFNTNNVATKLKSYWLTILDAFVVFSSLYWLITRLPTASANEVILYFIGGVVGFLFAAWMKNVNQELDDF